MSSVIETNLKKKVGWDDLSDSEKVVFLEKTGGAVLSLAVTRFVESLSEEEAEAFDYYLDTEPTPEVLLDKLITQHPSFLTVLKEVVQELNIEVENIFQKS